MRRLFLLALLWAAPVQAQTPQPVSLGWDASASQTVDGYVVARGETCGLWTLSADVGPVLQYTFPADAYSQAIPNCYTVRAYAGGEFSPDAVPLVVPPQLALDPRCALTGDQHVFVFLTSFERAGARVLINMQLASPGSPISAVNVLGADGKAVSTIQGAGPNGLTAVGAIWFPTPPPGSYSYALEAVSAYGCHSVSSVDAAGNTLALVVK